MQIPELDKNKNLTERIPFANKKKFDFIFGKI